MAALAPVNNKYHIHSSDNRSRTEKKNNTQVTQRASLYKKKKKH